MIVWQVLFNKEGIEEVITLEEISTRDDYLQVKDQIYCPTGGCPCKMVYVPRGVKIAYFKKLKGHNHNESCPHYVPTGNDGRPRRTVGVNSSILRSEQKRSMLKGIYKTYLETEEQRNERLERDRERARSRRNQRVNNNNNNRVEEVVNSPTTSNDGERLLDGQRTPPVRRRHSVLDVVNSDFGRTIVVIGTLKAVLNSENQSILTISDTQNRKEFRLYLEQVFYENSPLNTPQMFTSLKRMVESIPNIMVSVVGEIIIRNDELAMLVLAEEDFGFNGVRLATLILNNNVA